MAFRYKRKRSYSLTSRKRGKFTGRGFRAVKSYSRNRRTGGFTGIESKFADFEFNAALSATLAGSEVDPATALCLTAIQQGDGESQRDGRKCTITQVMVRGLVQITAIAAATLQNGMFAKIIMVQDTQTNGQQLNAEDVFDDPTDTDLDALTFRNLAFAKRFKILATRNLRINPSAGAGDGAANDQGNYVIPFFMAYKCKMPVVHTGTTAAIGSISDNSIHLIAVASPAAAGGVSTIMYKSRCRFVG